MGAKTPINTSFTLPDGREVFIETGKLATQAHGSCVVKLGKTMIFASVVSDREPKEDRDYFPLFVDYQEKFASIGRIPGNFFRREARLSDYEILICRLIDRAIRPLFPEYYMNETQVVVNLISADDEILPDSLAALAASTALCLSDIPWEGPISEVRVAKIRGEYAVNPNRSDLENATLDIIVAATKDNLMMVEGESKECQESELIEAIKVGHEAIKVQCEAQLRLAEKVSEKATVKREVEIPPVNEELKQKIEVLAKNKILEIARAAYDKLTRKDQFKELEELIVETIKEEMGEEYLEENETVVKEYYDKLRKETIRSMILDEKIRLDGRKYDEVRSVWTEVDYLPSAHGSAIFTRGETQALTSLTIGSKLDQMLIDNALDFRHEKFILHYNFLPFSVGEVKPMRGPGRREVGHANLAARSLKQVFPEENPYTIRIVSDILESNGSSSMATVCAGSMALMDGGIQIKKAVSGIAMGLISENGKTAILSDILGDEDALGDMDFKVTGTQDGITACQMDIKIDGLSFELLEEALMQARQGRLHILSEMNKSISKPNSDLKPHAPRVVEFRIPKDFIGAVIGPGGKVIQEIQERTGTTINIEEENNEGIVSIYASDKSSIEKAKADVDRITHVPEVGDVYDASVATIMPYGIFVDFMGKSGLVHISEISHSRIDNLSDLFQEGDIMKVKLIGRDHKTGKLKLSRKALMPKPERKN